MKARLPLWSSYSLMPNADLPAGGSFSFPPESAKKEQEGEMGKGKGTAGPQPSFSQGRQTPEWGWEQVSARKRTRLSFLT